MNRLDLCLHYVVMNGLMVRVVYLCVVFFLLFMPTELASLLQQQ